MIGQMNVEGDRTLMDKMGVVWLRLSGYFGGRPIQICGILAGALILIILLFYSAANTTKNTVTLRDIQNAFCNGDAEVYTKDQEENCQKLLEQLLKNPTPEQRDRLRELVKETP